MTHGHVKETCTSKWREHCHVFTCSYPIYFIPVNMVRTRVRGELRMRKRNMKITVLIDVVPEHRTERFLLRFRPVGRFCELRFRYLSSPTGREGEISRPLDHMRQIPFIHLARPIDSTNCCIYRTVVLIFFSMFYAQVCNLTSAHALLQGHSFRGSDPLLSSCCFLYGAMW